MDETPQIEQPARQPAPKAGSSRENWFWTKKRELAARLLAEDELSNKQIAEACGVTVRSIQFWQQHPEFRAKQIEHVKEFREKVLNRRYSLREKRIELREELIDSLLTIKNERAAQPAMANVPGGKSGLIQVTLKSMGVGDKNQIYMEHTADTGLAAEIRAGLREIAQEVGELVEKHEVVGSVTHKHQLDVSRLSDEELVTLFNVAQKMITPATSDVQAIEPQSEGIIDVESEALA